MERKELAKIFMTISKLKKTFILLGYTQTFQRLKG